MNAPFVALSEPTPPHDVEIEQALLGAILLNAEALDRVRDLVCVEDFHEEAHRKIFATMISRRDAGEAIDRHLVSIALGGKAPFGHLTVAHYVGQLACNAITVINAPSYARTIAQAARMRAVLVIAQAAVARMTEGDVSDPAEFAAHMIAELDPIVSASLGRTAQRTTLGDATAAVLEQVDRRRRGLAPVGARYGIPSLDQATLGLQGGQLVIVAGRPGAGKTVAAVHIGASVARTCGAVAFFSLEMNDIELGERALAALAYDSRLPPITYRAIREAQNLSDEKLQRLVDAKYAARELPLWIEQEGGLTVAQIAARARQMRLRAERKGIPLSLIVIDHIGLIRASKRYAGNRVQEMSEISWALKGLAKELDVPVLALSQLNRQVEHREDKRPQLADLRESGSIEQDADVVLGLYREAYYLERKTDRTPEEEDRLARNQMELEVEILKQRSGPTKRVFCFCDVACNVIAEATR